MQLQVPTATITDDDQQARWQYATAACGFHQDEVWCLSWSHSGNQLATASKDGSAAVWAMQVERTAIVLRRDLHLTGHESGVAYIAWSPDDGALLTASENVVRIWDTKTGSCTRARPLKPTDAPGSKWDNTITALVWAPDGSRFFSGDLDGRVVEWDVRGNVRNVWEVGGGVLDLAMMPDGERLVVLGRRAKWVAGDGDGNQAVRVQIHALAVYDLRTRAVESTIYLPDSATSLKISPDARHALVSTNAGFRSRNAATYGDGQELVLCDLETGEVVRRFKGQRQGRHVVRSCFGGTRGEIVASGSEDGKVYLWSHEPDDFEAEIGARRWDARLNGHGAGTVNAIAWNPADARIFASCSDDHTARIWCLGPTVGGDPIAL